MSTSILLVGIGGYGANYTHELIDNAALYDAHIAGVVDPFAKTARDYERLAAMNIPFYNTVEEFYAEKTAELACIATPIQFHAPQAIYCMEHGSHVLCEKPASATYELAYSMKQAAERTGKKLAIGFQWCYDRAMMALKKDFDSGLLGKPISLKCIVLWPRDRAYYTRGLGWAGKKYDKNGDAIFDSVASNATAHYLENMLWLTGKGFAGTDIADMDVDIRRANPIETFDTAILKGTLENGAKFFYTATHAGGNAFVQDPHFVYTFENAVVTFGKKGERNQWLIAHFNDGTQKIYGLSNRSNCADKLPDMLDWINGKLDFIPCPIDAALRHAKAMQMVFEKQAEATVMQGYEDNGFMTVDGLAEELISAFDNAF